MMIWPPANAIYRRETYDNYPAAKAVLHAVFEGLQLPMDLALAVESKLLRQHPALEGSRGDDPFALPVDGRIEQGRAPPGRTFRRPIGKIGVLGAGLMGGGIAYVSANAGLEVVLIDRDLEAAEKGKAHSHKLDHRPDHEGPRQDGRQDALLARITPTADYAELEGCDLVVEAVFEDPEVKAEATQKAEAVDRTRRHLRLQHLDAADHRARRDSSSPSSSSASISSRRSRR